MKEVVVGDDQSVLRYRKCDAIFYEASTGAHLDDIMDHVIQHPETKILCYGTLTEVNKFAAAVDKCVPGRTLFISVMYVFLTKDDFHGKRVAGTLTVDRRLLLISTTKLKTHRTYLAQEATSFTVSLLQHALRILDLPPTTSYRNVVVWPTVTPVIDAAIQFVGEVAMLMKGWQPSLVLKEVLMNDEAMKGALQSAASKAETRAADFDKHLKMLDDGEALVPAAMARLQAPKVKQEPVQEPSQHPKSTQPPARRAGLSRSDSDVDNPFGWPVPGRQERVLEQSSSSEWEEITKGARQKPRGKKTGDIDPQAMARLQRSLEKQARRERHEKEKEKKRAERSAGTERQHKKELQKAAEKEEDKDKEKDKKQRKKRKTGEVPEPPGLQVTEVSAEELAASLGF